MRLGEVEGVEHWQQCHQHLSGQLPSRVLGLALGALAVVLEVRLEPLCHLAQLIALLGDPTELVEILLDGLGQDVVAHDLDLGLLEGSIGGRLVAHFSSSTISASTISSSLTSLVPASLPPAAACSAAAAS